MDWLQSKAFEASRESFTEVLTRLREYMLLDGRPKSTIIAYTRSVRDLMEDIGKVPLEVTLASCHYPKQSAILHLLYDTGLRAREVSQLRLGDFDKANAVLYVRYGKGGKHRVVDRSGRKSRHYCLALQVVPASFNKTQPPTGGALWVGDGLRGYAAPPSAVKP